MSANLLLPMIDGNSKLPSYYEFMILSQIESTLIPTVRHIINTVIDRLQFNFSALDYSEDGIIILKSLIDSYFIYFYDATFVEGLYGLCRISNNGNSTITNSRFLSPKDRNYNIILKALLPSLLNISYKYLSYYLQTFPLDINNQGYEITNNLNYISAPNGIKQQRYSRKSLAHLRRLINTILTMLNRSQAKVQNIIKVILNWFINRYIRLFPSVKMVLRLLSLFQQIRYLFQISPYYDLVLLVTNVTVVRRSSLPKNILSHGVDNISEIHQPDRTTSGSTLSSNSTSTTNWSSVFFLGLMALRVAEHLLHPRNSGQQHNSSSSKFFPPPPSPPEVGRGCVMPPDTDASICPLCRNTRQQPAVSTGGYVFCFTCLLASLQEKAQCPITGIPCTESDIIRIFEEERF